ncbi:hypothetical protein BCR34DRAFT_654838 [Clohesyomyces aquaticus]|uniref:Uncharacterized protein n=1 Tax=Clohesyomyces aquaticus TaxID=1231657 RepID=A0A1Y1ZJP4_9PLEO|nr:hypothetical protein BCR34DRAFT_654838 [Clohesyomyces aquaticus]
MSPPPSSPSSPDLQPCTPGVFPFLSLSRELRDQIYSHLFASSPSPSLRAPFHGLKLHLHYGYRCCPIPIPPTDADIDRRPALRWLWTSKTIMREGLEEFGRGAEWVWWGVRLQSWGGEAGEAGEAGEGGCEMKMRKRRECGLKIPRVQGMKSEMDSESGAQIPALVPRTSFSLYVGNLSHWETPYRNMGMDGREGIHLIASAMRCHGASAVEKIRLQAHSYSISSLYDFDSATQTFSGQILHVLANLQAAFAGVEVGKWELEIMDGQRKRSEIVLDVGKDGTLRIVANEQWGRMTRAERLHTDICKEWRSVQEEGERDQAEAMRVRREQMRVERERKEERRRERAERKALEEVGAGDQGAQSTRGEA